MGIGAEDLPSVSLAISFAALLIAGISLLWQILAFNLMGSRLRVVMLLGRRDDLGTVVSAPVDRWPQENGPIVSRTIRFTTEIVIVEVHNSGRTPVTVDPPSLTTGDHAATNAKPLDNELSGPRRIPPGDVARWSLSLWPLVRGFREHRPGKGLSLRAEVLAGGHLRPRRSSRRKPLVVPAHAETLTYESRPSDAWVIYNELVHRLGDEVIGLGFAAMRIDECLREGGGQSDVVSVLKEATGQAVGAHMAAFWILERWHQRRGQREAAP